MLTSLHYYYWFGTACELLFFKLLFLLYFIFDNIYYYCLYSWMGDFESLHSIIIISDLCIDQLLLLLFFGFLKIILGVNYWLSGVYLFSLWFTFTQWANFRSDRLSDINVICLSYTKLHIIRLLYGLSQGGLVKDFPYINIGHIIVQRN